LKEYYSDLKAGKKGKSGQKRGKGITWAYYNMMSFLDGVKNSNENTISNLDFDTPAKLPRTDNEEPCPSFPGESESSGESPSSRVEKNKDLTPKSTLPVKCVQNIEPRFGCKIDS